MSKTHQDIEGVLVNSEYFVKFILPAWMRRNPDAARALALQVRGDPESEKDVQYHIKRLSNGK